MKSDNRSRSGVAISFLLSITMILSLSLLAFAPSTSIRRVKLKKDLASAYLNNEAGIILEKTAGVQLVRSLPYDFTAPENPPAAENYYTDGSKSCYKDSTIEVVCWKEKSTVNNSEVSFAEVRIKHPSQFRRQWSYGDYNSQKYQFPSNIFDSSNGVIGMSDDFYKHRKYGIIIQYGTVICDKRGPHPLDVLVIDYNGDFRIWNDAELSKHIEKNGADDIMLSFTFGPALMVDGKAYNPDDENWYKLGEPKQFVGRAAIGQIDKLHYLLCTVSNPGLKREQVVDVMASKGCTTIYNLDGGQSGTMLFNGRVYNDIAYTGDQRPMSDILYFCSAE